MKKIIAIVLMLCLMIPTCFAVEFCSVSDITNSSFYRYTVDEIGKNTVTIYGEKNNKITIETYKIEANGYSGDRWMLHAIESTMNIHIVTPSSISRYFSITTKTFSTILESLRYLRNDESDSIINLYCNGDMEYIKIENHNNDKNGKLSITYCFYETNHYEKRTFYITLDDLNSIIETIEYTYNK